MSELASVKVGDDLEASGDAPAEWVVESDGLSGWFDGPPAMADVLARPGQHGAFESPAFRRGRVVTLAAWALAADSGTAGRRRAQAAAVLGDGTYSMLEVAEPDGTATQARVRIDSMPLVAWRPGWDQVRAQWQFYAPDPFRYSTVVQERSTLLPQLIGGLEFDLFTDGATDTGYLEFGEAGSNGRVLVENEGTAQSWPIFVASGALPHGFTIVHVASGRRLVYAGPVIPGSPVGIDTATGRALEGASVASGRGRIELLGAADRSGRLVVREFAAVPAGGSAEFAFQAAEGGAESTLTIHVQDTYW